MARYQVTLAYDGTEFSGFQRQAQRKINRTVQDEVEAALRRIGWQGDSILAAGRTDTGVHASGQVVAFDLDWSHTQQDLLAAMNANLPRDIAAREACLTKADFHPRFDALARRYRYRIFCSPLRDPLGERFAWRTWPAVKLAPLQRASALLLGTHDFGAFGSPPNPRGTTVRHIYRSDWRSHIDDQGNESFIFEIIGNAFLYRMVRRIVSMLVQIGQGSLEIERLVACLASGEKKAIKTLAPAHGLCLVEVIYEKPAELPEPGDIL